MEQRRFVERAPLWPRLAFYFARLAVLIAACAVVLVAAGVTWALVQGSPVAHAVSMALFAGALLLGLGGAGGFLSDSDPRFSPATRVGSIPLVFPSLSRLEQSRRDIATEVPLVLWLFPTGLAMVGIGILVHVLFVHGAAAPR